MMIKFARLIGGSRDGQVIVLEGRPRPVLQVPVPPQGLPVLWGQDPPPSISEFRSEVYRLNVVRVPLLVEPGIQKERLASKDYLLYLCDGELPQEGGEEEKD
jgi:hypothetical protein